jgi:hypothetical protein
MTGDPTVKSNPRRTRRSRQSLRLWTLGEARAAAPYIASIARSIREYALEARNQRRLLKSLAEKPGRPDRAELIAQQDAGRDLARAEEQLRDAIEELEGLDICCLDPIGGQVLVPFVQDEQLAWYIFDLFDPHYFRAWRYQSDPEETRRKLTALRMS